MLLTEVGEWLAAVGLIMLAAAVPNMLFRSKHPPSGPLTNVYFRHMFVVAPYLFWAGLGSLALGLLIGLATR